jgi:pimeloyl-ACP methyl ester carboxylesterase
MSGGGWLGELYARRHPEALSGLVLESVCGCFRERLADPACFLSPFHPQWRAKLEAAKLLDPSSHAEAGRIQGEWVELEGVGSVFRRRGGPALLVSPAPLPPEIRAVMATLWTMDARKWLKHLRLPALVIAGTADPLCPLAHARAVHEAIPGSKFVAVEGAGHVPTIEHRPEVRAAVEAFLGQIVRR